MLCSRPKVPFSGFAPSITQRVARVEFRHESHFCHSRPIESTKHKTQNTVPSPEERRINEPSGQREKFAGGFQSVKESRRKEVADAVMTNSGILLGLAKISARESLGKGTRDRTLSGSCLDRGTHSKSSHNIVEHRPLESQTPAARPTSGSLPRGQTRSSCSVPLCRPSRPIRGSSERGYQRYDISNHHVP